MKKRKNKFNICFESYGLGALSGILSFNLAFVFIVISIAFKLFPPYIAAQIPINLLILPIFWLPLLIGYYYFIKNYKIVGK